MRAKTAKHYRRLMRQHQQLGFHQPYQVLVDTDIVKEADRCRIDLPSRLSATLHGEVKILITQCCIRQLYGNDPENAAALEVARSFERRRCGHHPDDHPEPLSPLECISSVVGPQNKWRYSVASQDTDIRRILRGVPGVPLVYLKRSVMILEPLSIATSHLRERQEQSKFREGLKQRNVQQGSDAPATENEPAPVPDGAPKAKRKRTRGPKGPNPLSMKKKKKGKEGI